MPRAPVFCNFIKSSFLLLKYPPSTITTNQASEQNTIAETSQFHQSRSLRLPAELRNRIYELALINDKAYDVATRATTEDDASPVKDKVAIHTQMHASEPALLYTCKEIREEGHPIFYGRNAFGHDLHSTHEVLDP